MTPGGRIAAAIEVLTEMDSHHRPATEALRDWGRTHRFAGSGDRAAIGNLVFDALRHKASAQWMMDEESARSAILGTLAVHWGKSVAEINGWFEGDKHSPLPFSDEETKALGERQLKDAPVWVQADVPEWTLPLLEANFDDELIAEGQALAQRPPVGLRVNTLKANRAKVAKALARFNPIESRLAPDGLTIAPPTEFGRSANVQADGAYQKGWVEVQDEGSQVVSHLVFAQPGEQVLDYCAGAGGKTLALAACMQNKGQVFAYDADRNRLSGIYERIKRGGLHNVQIREPGQGSLDDLTDRMDRVVVDAPCSGSGVWRRRPDAKWRLTLEALERRLEEQRTVLREASAFVKPGGYLCYITCSVFPSENEGQVYQFLEDKEEQFELLSAGEVWQDLFGFDAPQP
ncbi:MAG: RsmB/NOP family class I SAM-dependent RNA methyltransferase, partial [Rhizobiales bacterium]|nr:RsmB/NOP family class I SAM-dependent RNA methyltransferase [Hyphomicrobiales bacterium]